MYSDTRPEHRVAGHRPAPSTLLTPKRNRVPGKPELRVQQPGKPAQPATRAATSNARASNVVAAMAVLLSPRDIVSR